ncbi:MAG: hypothetical protein A2161_20085 [Candidatus Schekmanbacteria bacterium RBG_13_48_7]|uniref:4Fe-4S ferredoxin-type domain-containing protein n=1 Tax=Candidatus Schekmanbacteria bacterium RBG_13_48_7 TaxID=1817878 RepID=A0A1F7RZR0_9BACT|nr:MAG: hypothetical protein A2161_20085 [Candidatus Schekmanbacteria bacterium RBG_13_48_7]
MGTDHIHRVCTYEEAETAIRQHSVIYLNNCFCRTPAKEGKTPWSYCGHAIENCMGFHKPKEEDSPYIYREINREESLKLFEDWKKQGNFFRFMENDEWICFCCGCGCGWFRDKEGNKVIDQCLKSSFIEKTNIEKCTLCGDCVPVCAFQARSVENNEMAVQTSLCYGCSACEYACSEKAIVMVPRN